MVDVPDHAHDPGARLCAACTVARFEELRKSPRARVHPEVVAETIRQSGGDVWRARREHGISYEHALRIRRGWRGGGRVARCLRYRSRGYFGDPDLGSHRAGWTTPEQRLLAELGWTALDGAATDANLDVLAVAEATG